MSDSPVVVTGGCGFIGSHLVRALRTNDTPVIVLDDFSTGSLSNLDLSDTGVRVENFELGMDSTSRLRDLIQGSQSIFHLASQKHDPGSLAPASMWNTNVAGTRELLEAALDVGVTKVVFTSSVYAYGRTSGAPMIETEEPNPHTTYGISKLCAERECYRIAQMAPEIAITCARLFFTYGPRQYCGLGNKSVIVRNFERMLAGERPVICGDGLQAFDYIYVDDVVNALLAIMDQQKEFGIVNVGSGVATTIKNLTDRMLRVSGKQYYGGGGDINTATDDWTVGTYRVANIEKLEKEFNIYPSTSLYTGLYQTWKWMKERQAVTA